MNITSGRIPRPIKCIVYGVEGIGKSTFASNAPEPLFIDTEGSTARMDVRRFDAPTSWEMLLAEVRYVVDNPNICKTLVIDTLDWAEKLALKAVLSKWSKKGIEEFGYGKGYVYLNEEFGRLPNLLNEVVDKGVNVMLTAHAALRKFEQPDEMGAYDRYEMKLLKQNAPMMKEWADMVLFANYKTVVVGGADGKTKGKAQGNERVMYTTHAPCWDAKNRDGLPDIMPFSFAGIAHCFITAAPAPEEPSREEMIFEVPSDRPADAGAEPPKVDIELLKALKPLEDLMRADGITERDIREAVGSRGYFPADLPVNKYPVDFITGNLVGAWEQVKEIIRQLKEQSF